MIRSGTLKAVLLVSMLCLMALGGYGFYRYRNADLESLLLSVPDLPRTVVQSEIVKQLPGQLPMRDSDLAIQGHYTVIEYRQKNCPACARLDSELEKFLKVRRDVAVRKIDLADQWSDKTTLRDYGRTVWYTPFVVIYGADGKQIKADDGGKRDAARLLNAWLKRELVRVPTPGQ
ncbi:MAG: hypothetical protein OEV31_06735 [Gammaproteobacteria bacterium]|nr:hypothetical protein [Gammaproteobacteria bacterium]